MSRDEPVRIYINMMDPLDIFTGAGHFLTYCYEGLHSTGMPVDYSMDYVAAPNTLNILVEGFKVETAKRIQERRAQLGGDHIIIATEFLTGETFNLVGDTTDSHYDDKAWWQERFDAFSMIAQTAKAIWVSTEHQVEGYQTAYPNTPVLKLPYCFSNQWGHRTSRIPQKRYEVVFTGTQTERRKGLFHAIGQRAAVYIPRVMHEALYMQIVSQAKIALHLKLKEGWPYTSPMRHLGLLHCDTYVISEICDLPGELDAFVETVHTDDLADVVYERANDPSLAEKTREQRMAFMSAGNLQREFRALLDQSFPILSS